MAVPKYPFPVVGGLERQSHELSKALARRGHDISALSTLFDPLQRQFEVIEGVRLYRIQWFRFRPVRFLLSAFAIAHVLWKLRREVDLIHVHNVSWFGAFVTMFAKVTGLPVVTKLPGFGEFGIPGMARGALGPIRIALLKQSDAIIAMTRESVAELDRIGYPPARILKVTNGIAIARWFPRQPRSAKTVVVAYVGRLYPEKGLPDLLHAWQAIIKRTTMRVTLRLIGDGPQATELRGLVWTLGLGHAVHFLGHRSDVAAELATADLFVLPSYAEGNSNAILEAMSCGLPIVATRVGGATIQLGTQGERFLVPAGDRQALANALLELIEDATLRLRLGAEMRARIEKFFSIERIAETYEQAYELILSKQSQQIGRLNAALFGETAGEDSRCVA